MKSSLIAGAAASRAQAAIPDLSPIRIYLFNWCSNVSYDNIYIKGEVAAITKQNEPGGVHHQHDKGYKLLLTHKNTFIELLQSFVKEAWVNSIREDNLTRIDKSYILQDFSEKEADIVYQLQDKEKNIIFYVLLELQSEVDFLMPFRLLLYMVEIWRDFFNNTPRNERERKDFRLPCIIPAVLYNGAGKWTACTDFRETQAGYQEFGKYPLDFRYILFDVNRYDERELYNLANLIASIFILDQKHDDVKDLKNRLWNLVNTLKKMTPAEFDAVKTWLKACIQTPFFPRHASGY